MESVWYYTCGTCNFASANREQNRDGARTCEKCGELLWVPGKLNKPAPKGFVFVWGGDGD